MTNITENCGVPELFGSLVFSEPVMRQMLPRDICAAIEHTIATGESLPSSAADVIASAMKDWAIEHGATHYTHWFQPMTGVTAEKHDSFISPTGDGQVLMEFSGGELIKGEPDASSFPSGGLRNTFEARGYTAWDPTSYAFIKDRTLCIPTVFYSYSGETLDKKTPLMRSMRAFDAQAVRVLRALGDTETKHVTTTAGAEQEYFLVPKELFDRRRDLVYTGRTLFGAHPPKGQELEDQYFGSIKPRVMAFMHELDEELWKLGVPAKTEHNEAAPAQHELAPIYASANIANDHNQIIMEMMKKVALRHGMVCLLHEKPFAGVNGSGKHNNWSPCTDSGKNLLKPGKNPAENNVFLLFLAAVIKAVDEHQDLLRISVATAGNDQRLGAAEAPPAIVSIHLGRELEEILEAIAQGRDYTEVAKDVLDTSVEALPVLYRDTSDRNRTSPLAFTGNKFEFRMLGSSLSIAGPNIVLNTIAADALCYIADRLESGDAPRTVVGDILKNHRRIIFNGNNYAREWVEEAKRRGLLNLASTADALPHYCDEKNVELFERHHVFSRAELTSRTDILLENYCKTINIEALTMIEMIRREIIPAVMRYSDAAAGAALRREQLLGGEQPCYERELVERIGSLVSETMRLTGMLESALRELPNHTEHASCARYCGDTVVRIMEDVRRPVDALEQITGKDYWPYPTYGELLFGIQ